ncbi:MAG: CofH family radical SAM protein [Bacteroidetes bacterium]|nr:CofH family radical SAM protein [Bacteroidota bacterium]
MDILRSLNTISALKIPDSLKEIAGKVFADQRINPQEGLLLFRTAPPGYLGMLAEFVRQQKNGNNVYFIRNFHIEPTNICVNKCEFCSYSHHFNPKSWDLKVEEMLGILKSQDQSVREVHITGAVHPEKELTWFGDFFLMIKKIRPDIHIKALSAVEIDFLCKKSKVTFENGLKYLKGCGLDSIPGGGAEIFDPVIRKKICSTKATGAEWLAIHASAHQLGISSNATMLYGHIEQYEHRISHLEALRELQDQTGGFNAFIPLKFRNRNNKLNFIKETSVIEDMKNYAVSRIYLDNFPHLKGYWPMIGKSMAQLSLSFGVDDLDGTINDSTKIYSEAGSGEQNPAMTTSEMVGLITQVNRIPVERDSLYKPA